MNVSKKLLYAIGGLISLLVLFAILRLMGVGSSIALTLIIVCIIVSAMCAGTWFFFKKKDGEPKTPTPKNDPENQTGENSLLRTGLRLIVMFIFMGITLGIILFLVGYFLGNIAHPLAVSGTLWLMLWALFLKMEFFIFYNHAYEARFTTDMITKKLTSFGRGIHFRFPWEELSKARNTQTRTLPLKDGTNNCIRVPTKDGGIVELSGGSLQWRPSDKRIHIFDGQDETVINQGFRAILLGEITPKIGGTDTTKIPEEMGKIFDKINEEYNGPAGNAKVTAHEERYGVDFILAKPGDWEFPKNTQELLDMSLAGKMYEHIKDNERLRLMLAAASDTPPELKMHTLSLNVDGNKDFVEALTPALAELAKAAPVLIPFLSTLGRGKGGGGGGGGKPKGGPTPPPGPTPPTGGATP